MSIIENVFGTFYTNIPLLITVVNWYTEKYYLISLGEQREFKVQKQRFNCRQNLTWKIVHYFFYLPAFIPPSEGTTDVVILLIP